MNNDFQDFDFSDKVRKAIVELGYEEPTPIQAKAIPLVLAGRDVIAKAPTGTGKTFAFAAPSVQRIDTEEQYVQTLVLCPTRELVIQTTEEFQKVGKYIEGLKILAVYGGQNIERQLAGLRKHPQVIVGTPGRIMDHLRRGTLKLDRIKLLVLDEADEMLNMGFREDLDIILLTAPKERQTVLFSATIPKQIAALSKNYQIDPETVTVDHQNIEVPKLLQYYIEARESEKLDALTRLLDANNYGLVLIFCNTKRRVDDLSMALAGRGYFAEALHGDLRQTQRDKVMSKFRTGGAEILVATDVAARGIDVDDIEAVINYDIPGDEEYYVHRIGRTARANKQGVSFTFVSGRELGYMRQFEKLTNTKIVKYTAPPAIVAAEGKARDCLNGLKSAISEERHTDYKRFINDYIGELNGDGGDYTGVDIAAALLRSIVDKSDTYADVEITPLPRGADKKSSRFASNDRSVGGGASDRGARGERPPRPRATDGNSTRYFINVGFKDKIKEDSLKDFLCDNLSLTHSDIYDVYMLDTFSFFEIDSRIQTSDVDKLTGKLMGSRRVSVDISDAKTGRPSRGGKSSDGYGAKKSGSFGKSDGNKRTGKTDGAPSFKKSSGRANGAYSADAKKYSRGSKPAKKD
jgi:ATP-dependent RNA helicase DeaD